MAWNCQVPRSEAVGVQLKSVSARQTSGLGSQGLLALPVSWRTNVYWMVPGVPPVEEMPLQVIVVPEVTVLWVAVGHVRTRGGTTWTVPAIAKAAEPRPSATGAGGWPLPPRGGAH